MAPPAAKLLICAESGALRSADSAGLARLGLGPWPAPPGAARDDALEQLVRALHAAWRGGAPSGEVALPHGPGSLRWQARRLARSGGGGDLLFSLLQAASTDGVGDELTRLRELVQWVPGAMYQFQMFPNGRAWFPFASAGFHALYGVEPREVIDDSNSLLRFVHRDDIGAFLDSIVASMQGLHLWLHEYRVQLPGQPTRWLRGRAMPYRQPDGSTLWHGYLVDVTGEIKARHHAERRELDFQAMFHAHPHPMWICAQGSLRILDANLAATSGYGIERDAFLGSGLADRHPPYERALLIASQGSLDKRVWTHLAQSGAARQVELRTSLVRFGEREELLVVATDVTTRESLLDALREAEMRQRLALSASGTGLWDWDLTTGIAVLSDTYWAMVEYEPGSEVADMGFLQRLIHPEDRERTLFELSQYAEGLRESGEVEYRKITRTGRILWVRGYAKVVGVDAQGRATRLVGTIKDVTEARLAKEEMIRLNVQLRAFSALRDRQLDSQRQEFALDLHDKVGPLLGSIKLAAEVAMMGDASSRAAGLRRIIELTDDGIRQVRDRSWQLFQPAPTSGLADALAALVDRHGDRFGVTTELKLDPMPVWLDEVITRELSGIVEQALCNAGLHAAASRVVVTGAVDDDNLTLMVQDNGRGFDTDRPQAHAHFGLFGMRERAIRISASLEIVSAPGQGTTVVVYLQRPRETPPPGADGHGRAG